MQIDFNIYLAKSDKAKTTLPQHTQDVIDAGICLVNTLCLTESEKTYWLEKIIRVAILHDLGKIHPDFQKSLQPKHLKVKFHPIRHEIISLWFCENFLNLTDDELFAIATHHKGVLKIGEPKRLEEEQLKEYLTVLYERGDSIMNKNVLIEWIKHMSLSVQINEKEIIESKLSDYF